MTRKATILKEITAVLKKHLMPSEFRAWLIGSQAEKTELLEGRDIDVAIKTVNVLDPEKLNALINDLDEIRTLYTIDLVWLNNASPEFTRTALKHAEILV